MIVIGYRCIGKTLTSKESKDYIDLDNYNFTDSQSYCDVALDLSKQGYTVFVSSHKEVRNCLSHYQDEDRIIEIFPSFNLEEEWKQRTRDKYYRTKNVKDQISMIRVNKYFTEDIEDMIADDIKEKYIIEDLDNYTLDYAIKEIINE